MAQIKNLKLTITPATKEDILKLRALFTINLLKLTPFMPSTILVAKHEGEITGFIGFVYNKRTKTLTINRIATHAHFEKQRVARTLIGKAISTVAKQGLKKIVAKDVNPANKEYYINKLHMQITGKSKVSAVTFLPTGKPIFRSVDKTTFRDYAVNFVPKRRTRTLRQKTSQTLAPQNIMRPEQRLKRRMR
jgi:nucleoside diphosphate kinase